MNATLAKLTRLSDPPAADGALLDAFLAGDDGAFAALVRRHARLVFVTCRRVLRHQQDAEDAFQATFLVLARRAADVWPREALGAWLFGVAHRVALKARAVRSRRSARQRALEDAASADRPGPECDLAEAVHRVVSKLPEVYRAAVVACDLDGLSRKEAAERLGWSEGTLSGRLARARELLATRFRRAGLALPAGGLATVFATADAASAGVIQTTIDIATGGAAGAPVPVAVLTEGVVRSMALVKLKAMTAAVFTACLIGFGTVAVGAGVGVGDGDGDGKGGGQKQSQKQSQGGAPPAVAKGEPPKPPGPRVELAQMELDVLRQELEQAAKNKLDKAALDRLMARLEAADKLLGERPKPPAKVDPDPRAEAATRLEAAARLKMAQAAVDLRDAQARLDEAALRAEIARAQVSQAEAALAAARKQFEDAKKAAEAKPKPEPAPADAPAFTVHVRSLTAAEKVTRVKLTGSQTVLDALAHADGVSLKPEAVSVWLVRDGAVMPIDLGGITQRGETKTNYQVRAGDQLFVQVKAAK